MQDFRLLLSLEKVEITQKPLVKCKLDILDAYKEKQKQTQQKDQLDKIDTIIASRAADLIISYCQDIPTNRMNAEVSIYAADLAEKIQGTTLAQNPLVGRATLVNAAFLNVADAVQVLMQGGLWDALGKDRTGASRSCCASIS